jgi:glutathione synthase/RimK-type ligase-like ATP-grasp enzyme
LRRGAEDFVILLVGMPGDPPLCAVADSLRQMGADYVCLHQDIQLVRPWLPGCEARLRTNGLEVPLDQVRSAYMRPFGWATENIEERKVLETLLAWADTTAARIVNRPAASLPNNSKPLQGQWIRKLGLRIPETLVTTDPQAAREFLRCHGQVVYKSTSGVRSIVRRLREDRYLDLENVANCPTQFQRYIPGDDLRVHVLGDAVHAVLIRSDCDDYRYAVRNGGTVSAQAIELDPAITDSLRAVVRHMGLWLAGIDLRRTPSGEIYCLEINPSPGFTYYEQLAGVSLARSIAALLL